MYDSEKITVKKILNGDEKAFEDLFDIYHSKVYFTCLRFMKNQHDAKDMAQEVFIKIYRKLNNFDFQCSLATWIYTICTSTCLDALRKNNKIILEEWNESSAGSSSDRPEDAILFDELIGYICNEIKQNNEKTARVMNRRLFAKDSYDKIALEENIPASSARTYFTRGRRKLKQSVQKFLKE